MFTQGAQFLDEFWTEERISFVLTVSRENLLNGTLSSLVSADDMELKKPLRVSLVCVHAYGIQRVYLLVGACTLYTVDATYYMYVVVYNVLHLCMQRASINLKKNVHVHIHCSICTRILHCTVGN